MFREPFIVGAALAPGPLVEALNRWTDRLVDRLIARRVSWATSAPIPAAPAPAPASTVSPMPVHLEWRVDNIQPLDDADLIDNSTRLRNVPPAVRQRWGFPASADDINGITDSVYTAFASDALLHEGVTLAQPDAFSLLWKCPSGAVARLQARKLATLAGFARMDFTAYPAGKSEPFLDEIGATTFWIALRELDQLNARTPVDISQRLDA